MQNDVSGLNMVQNKIVNHLTDNQKNPSEPLSQNAQQINNFASIGLADDAFAKMPMDALMMAILVSRAELLESMLRDQVTTIKEKNATLKKSNNIMAVARNAKKDATESESTKMPTEVSDFFAENNIPWGDEDGTIPKELNSTKWDLAIENLKGWSESLTSTSQLDMSKMQSLSGKFNQVYEQLTQFIAKLSRTLDAITKNL